MTDAQITRLKELDVKTNRTPEEEKERVGLRNVEAEEKKRV